ncbi:unnamed protein product [Haemonchus placei]|uniref:Uncharacterized protein n=1 Tax=Haemonchus placei TaxID=6290 RepID=A0A158QPQ3_HAEPC|nr:unnamed protein product [Haemonchus placei]
MSKNVSLDENFHAQDGVILPVAIQPHVPRRTNARARLANAQPGKLKAKQGSASMSPIALLNPEKHDHVVEMRGVMCVEQHVNLHVLHLIRHAHRNVFQMSANVKLDISVTQDLVFPIVVVVPPPPPPVYPGRYLTYYIPPYQPYYGQQFRYFTCSPYEYYVQCIPCEPVCNSNYYVRFKVNRLTQISS